MNIDYSSASVPAEYKCAQCNTNGGKLWRQYQTFRVHLLCASCAGTNQDVDVSAINAQGKLHETDQIGGYVPAIPDEEGVSYWGYTSVPREGIEWWQSLPTRQEAQ